jgi:Protein of unknown function (DUF3987)/Primase C terminal 1 (PriCT-1)
LLTLCPAASEVLLLIWEGQPPHPSGAAYTFIDENAQIASAPEFLLKMLTQSLATARPSVGVAELGSEIVLEGRRNDTLFRHAAAMWHRGMTLAAVEAAVLAENVRCSPPLNDLEVREIARSACRYQQAPRLVKPNLHTGLRQWPTALGEEAFHGVAGEFVQLVRPETEADDAALLFSFLVTVGSIIGRGPYYQVGGDRHYTNLFTVIVGESAKARKGTSWGELRRFVELVDESWCKERVAGGLSSGEGLIYAVRDPIIETVAQREGKRVVGYESQTTDAGVEDKRLLAVESELSQALQSAGRDGNTLSAIIRLAWDGGPLRVLAKNAKAVCAAPHISIIAHITAAELKRTFTHTDMANGFANRFLWVCAARSKCLPFGGAVNESALAELACRMKTIIRFARNVGRVEFAAEARADWSRVYPSLSEGRPGLLGAITARAEAQTVRLAMLYSLLDESAEIGLQHLRAGLATWHYCDASARFTFGESLGDPAADEILSLLRASEDGVTRNELIDHFKRNKASGEIGRALALLQGLGLARVERRQTGGRAAEVWKAFPVEDRRNYEKNEKSLPLVRFPLCMDSRDVQGQESETPGTPVPDVLQEGCAN